MWIRRIASQLICELVVNEREVSEFSTTFWLGIFGQLISVEQEKARRFQMIMKELLWDVATEIRLISGLSPLSLWKASRFHQHDVGEAMMVLWCGAGGQKWQQRGAIHNSGSTSVISISGMRMPRSLFKPYSTNT